jgi:hypothetical protein
VRVAVVAVGVLLLVQPESGQVVVVAVEERVLRRHLTLLIYHLRLQEQLEVQRVEDREVERHQV